MLQRYYSDAPRTATTDLDLPKLLVYNYGKAELSRVNSIRGEKAIV